MQVLLKLSLTGTLLMGCVGAQADMVVPMNLVNQDGPGQAIGNITVRESSYGLVFEPDLRGLPPGMHGFHVHTNSTCEAALKDGKMTAAAAAGGHYDPDNSQYHGQPWGDGHRGDLPALFVNSEGKATYPVLAPRLHMNDLRKRSLMVHMGGDNHADEPQPLGGGGSRIACGVMN